MWHLPFRTSKEGGENYESHKNACSGASLYCLCTGRDHCHQRRIIRSLSRQYLQTDIVDSLV